MEKHYSIDAGRGEKMDGCPYSIYEDGHDVQDYIVPPKGYDFVGFQYEPLPNNQIYDGKLVAQYEKSSIQDRLTSNLWKILIPVIIVAVVGLVVWLAVSVFHSPKPKQINPKQPKTENVAVNVDTLVQETPETVATSDSTSSDGQEVVLDLTETVSQQEEVAATEEPQATPQPAADDPSVQFKNEFWTLIHQRTIMMDPYHELYVNYKDKATGEEYDYLRTVILKDYTGFKEWYTKLHRVSLDELKGVNDIDALKRKLNEI